MGRRDRFAALAGAALLAPISCTAHAASFLTEEQAAKALYPGLALEARWMTLSPEEVKLVEKRSGERVRSPRVRVLWGPDGQALIVDRVLGKHEFITYAVAVTSGGAVSGVEIMDYRETFGAEVRGAGWLSQFSGKTAADPLKVGKGVVNISGATLSSVHVTNGVRRVLQTHAVLKAKT